MKKTTKFLLTCTLFAGAFNFVINAESTFDGFIKHYEMSEPSKYGKIHVNKEIKHNRKELKAASLPSSYSSVEEGYITSVKDQGDFGTCWAFAASAASEASLIKNNGFPTSTNLSELQFAYFNYNNAYDSLGLLSGDKSEVIDPEYGYLDLGGTNFTSMLGYAKWLGPVDEAKNTKYRYSNASNSFRPTSNADAYQLDEAHLKDCYIIDTADISLMKQMILQYGAGDFAYHHYQEYDYSEPYYNDSTYGYCYIQTTSPSDYDNFAWSNHEVTVVGWDDNYARTNFNSISRPNNNGAWLVKNSWGSYWGDNGYFWISYEDSAMLAEPATFYEYESKDNYLYNYQYDGTINSSELSSGSEGGYTGGGYMANVFTAQHNEVIQAVSFITYEDDVDYEIKIYDEVTSTPTSGNLVSTTSGTSTYAGYHSVSLTTPATISEGNKFAAVVRLYDKDNANTAVTLVCDESYSDNSFEIVNAASAGQSYFSTNGSSWSDVSDSYSVNFRIKAFANEANIALESISFGDNSISLAEGESKTLTPTFNPSNASNKSLTWTSSNPDVASIDANGKVTALASGTTTITATSKENISIHASITINVKGITSISLSGTPNKIKYYSGETFDPTGLSVNVTYTDSTTTTIPLNECSWLDATSRLETLSVGSTSVICKYGNHEVTFNGISVEQAKNFRLLTDISLLREGDQVVFAENSKNVVAGNLSGKILSQLDITLNSSKSEITTLPDGALKLTVGKDGDYYTFANESGQLLGATGAKNLAWDNGSTNWNVSISNNSATIQNSTSSYGKILYNVSSPRFTTYTSNTSSSMLLPQIYYKTSTTLVDLTRVNAVIAKIIEIGTVNIDSKAKLDEVQNAYDALTSEEKAYVTNYQVLVDALQEYNDLVTARTERIQEVITAINNIGEVTLDSKDAIDQAEVLYNALSTDEKSEVTNYDVLIAAKATYEELNKPSTETSTSVSTPTSTTPSASTGTSTETPNKKGCRGSLIATSILVSAIALGGVLLSLKKKKENK